ncbi:MAG: hypothetical protein AAB532_01335 [Patescibacteria group bacterium]
MEILRVARLTSETKRTQIPLIPTLIPVLTHTKRGRALDLGIQVVELGGFTDQLLQLRQEQEAGDFRLERVGVYYTDGLGTFPSFQRTFTQFVGQETVRVEVEPPLIDPNNPNRFLSKTKSVGVVAHLSSRDTLPLSHNLLHLLLQDYHFKAATAAFFLSPSDSFFALFRGDKTPQLTKAEVDAHMAALEVAHKRLSKDTGLSQGIIRASLLREAVRRFDLRFFQGSLKRGRLQSSYPDRHIVT